MVLGHNKKRGVEEQNFHGEGVWLLACCIGDFREVRCLHPYRIQIRKFLPNEHLVRCTSNGGLNLFEAIQGRAINIGIKIIT